MLKRDFDCTYIKSARDPGTKGFIFDTLINCTLPDGLPDTRRAITAYPEVDLFHPATPDSASWYILRRGEDSSVIMVHKRRRGKGQALQISDESTHFVYGDTHLALKKLYQVATAFYKNKNPKPLRSVLPYEDVKERMIDRLYGKRWRLKQGDDKVSNPQIVTRMMMKKEDLHPVSTDKKIIILDDSHISYLIEFHERHNPISSFHPEVFEPNTHVGVLDNGKIISSVGIIGKHTNKNGTLLIMGHGITSPDYRGKGLLQAGMSFLIQQAPERSLIVGDSVGDASVKACRRVGMQAVHQTLWSVHVPV